MERNERLFAMLGEIDPALIAAVNLTPAPAKPAARLRKYLPTVACLCLSVLLGLSAWRILPKLASGDAAESESATTSDSLYSDAQDITGEYSTDKNQEASSSLIVQTTGSLYNHFKTAENTYRIARHDKTLSRQLLGEMLGTAQANHTSPGNPAAKPITYYRILGIDECLALAVIFDGEEDVYLYANQNYTPATLGDLIEAADLMRYLTLGDVIETRAKGENLHTTVYRADTALTAQYLLAPLRDTAPIRVYNGNSVLTPAKKPILLSIRGSLGMFGYPNWEAELTENGYLILPLFGNYYLFPVPASVRDAYLDALAQKTRQITQTELIPIGRGGALHGATTSAAIYHKLTLEKTTYQCLTCLYGMDASRVGAELGQIKAGAAEAAPTATCYRILGVSPAFGIAVRFSDEDTYYSYFNPDYRPETLGDLIADMGLSDYLRSSPPTVIYREAAITQTASFQKADDELLWQWILSHNDAPNTAAANTKKPQDGTYTLDLPLQIPLFSGSEDYTLRITEEGMLYIDLLGIRCVFDIGFDREQMARYALALLLRQPDFLLRAEDETVLPQDKRNWDSQPLHVRYSGLTWEGISYATDRTALDPAAVKAELGITSAVSLDPDTRMLSHTNVTVSTVEGYSSRHAVAVRFAADSHYYLYVNRGYVGQNLRDFMEENNIRENSTLSDFYTIVTGVKKDSGTIVSSGFTDPVNLYFTGVDESRAWEILFGDPYAPRTDIIHDQDFLSKHYLTMGFTLYNPHFCGEALRVILSKDGYLFFRMENERGHTYEIGKERAAAFLDYILTECLEPNEVRDGALLIPYGETRMSVITEQVTRRFRTDE